MEIPTQPQLYHCTSCEATDASVPGLRQHTNLVHKGITFPCKICNKAFPKNYNLQNHMRLHTGERPFVCKICKKSYASNTRLNRHTRTHLGDNGKLYICSLCNKRFGESSTLKQHMLDYTDERPFECKICGAKFKTKKDIVRHSLVVHDIKRKLKCTYCDKVFWTQNSLKGHIRCYHPAEILGPQSCVFCGKEYSGLTTLWGHIRMHIEENLLSCSLCNSKFPEKSQLYNHMWSTHTKERAHKCQICKAEFLFKPQLITHQARIHSKKYPCSKCHAIYFEKGELQKHYARRHSPKTIQCFLCQKRFRYLSDLRTHQSSTVHTQGNIRVTCVFCTDGKKYFMNTTSFLQHMCKHTGEKFHICSYCQAELVDKYSLKKHMSLHKGELF